LIEAPVTNVELVGGLVDGGDPISLGLIP